MSAPRTPLLLHRERPADPTVRRRRALVLGVALLALVPKFAMAATTFGTNDVWHWLDFLHAVRQDGPIGVYSHHFHASLYNHPPLIGYYLELIQGGTHLGIDPKFSIRAVSSLADVATALLVFELASLWVGRRAATVAGLAAAASPVLVVISGYHGNTDPIFTMLVLLSTYLLVVRDRPAAGGVALALALGVKIVPVVVVPCLIGYALRRGSVTAARYVSAFVLVSLTFWLPALIQEWAKIKENVFGYAGVNAHEWGLDQLGGPHGTSGWSHLIQGPARMLIVAICAIVPAVIVWRRPNSAPQAVCLALAGFLALTPTFGPQYLVWGAATSLLLSVRWGIAFNVLAGALLVQVYTRWNGGLLWDRAHPSAFQGSERVLSLIVWAVLLGAMMAGMKGIFRPEEPQSSSVRPAPAHHLRTVTGTSDQPVKG